MTAAESPDRAEAMGRRLDRSARHLEIRPDGVELLGRAFRAAMEPRRERIEDDHHPDYLHPARTVLILMDDAGVTDPVALAAAALAESRDRALAVPTAAVEAWAPAVARRLRELETVVGTGEDRELEALLALPAAVALLAVAERLDHARHLHLRPPEEWPEYHARTCRSFAPVAARVHATLGDRLAWWCESFRRRFLTA